MCVCVYQSSLRRKKNIASDKCPQRCSVACASNFKIAFQFSALSSSCLYVFFGSGYKLLESCHFMSIVCLFGAVFRFILLFVFALAPSLSSCAFSVELIEDRGKKTNNNIWLSSDFCDFPLSFLLSRLAFVVQIKMLSSVCVCM